MLWFFWLTVTCESMVTTKLCKCILLFTSDLRLSMHTHMVCFSSPYLSSLQSSGYGGQVARVLSWLRDQVRSSMVKNVWSFTSSFLYVFMALCLGTGTALPFLLLVSVWFYFTAAECQNRWLRLRERFTKEKRLEEKERRNESTSEIPKRRPWHLFPNMSFLSTHIRKRR